MQDLIVDCELSKEEGNNKLKANDFNEAIKHYSDAIQKSKCIDEFPPSKLAIYYANRAFVRIKLQDYGLAIIDAEASIAADQTYQKAYLRLGFSKQILQHYREAYAAYKKAFQLSGNKEQEIYNKLKFCKHESEEHLKIKKMSMLQDENERSLKVKLYQNWKEIQVEKQYTGLNLQGQVTPQWVVSLMDYMSDQKTLHKKYVLQLIDICKGILCKYRSLVQCTIAEQEQFTICGDIHGQYYDLMNIFKINGRPDKMNRYLFNGDFVDRGSFSVECMLTLIAWKCVSGDVLHMTRGNHEAKQVNMVYGFKGEVEAKYKDIAVYEAFSDLFCCLPLVYVFNHKVMVCHGGLPSTDGVKLNDITNINRFIEPPESGLMCDLLWADPMPQKGRAPSKRGVSMGFGSDITDRFLQENGLELLIRSHQVKMEGYEVAHEGKCVTIFSAPNYCDFTNNIAAVIRLPGNTLKPKYKQFKFVEHPKIGPMAYANNYRGMF